MLSDHQLKKRDIETLKHWLQQKYGGYKTIFTAVMANNILYRGVRCEQRPITISRISYPPVDKVTTCQRLNRVGQPRFYCSAAAPAVFYELRAKEGDRIALSQWEVTEPFWVRNLGYHPHALRQMGTQRQSILMRERLTNPIPNETKENYRIRRQLAKAFAADVPAGKEYRYKQSIAINEWLPDEFSLSDEQTDYPTDFPRTTKIAGTVYPALKMRGDPDNLVLLPEFVDSSLRIKSVWYVKVEAADETSLAYRFLTVELANTFSNEEIQWQENIGPENSRRSYFSLENRHWVLRDGNGRIYDFH